MQLLRTVEARRLNTGMRLAACVTDPSAVIISTRRALYELTGWSGTNRLYLSDIRGEAIKKSAVLRLHATGIFQTTVMRNKALTSGSWGWVSSASQKKMSRSSSPREIIAPIC